MTAQRIMVWSPKQYALTNKAYRFGLHDQNCAKTGGMNVNFVRGR